MAVLWQYYLGIAVGSIAVIGFLVARAPVLLVIVGGIWLFYTTLRCPNCKTLIRRNRVNRWTFPARTCLKCGRDLTKP